MSAELAVVLLAAAGAEPEAVAATVASIRAEAGDGVALLTAGTDAPEAILGAGALLAFARPGDRWTPGTLEARLRPLRARPDAALAIAGHALRAPAGDGRLLVVPAPLPPVDPVDLLLRASVEPSAVLVRAAALDRELLALLEHPHGEAVVWSRLAQAHGLLPSGEVAAEVPFDPERHGHAPGSDHGALEAAAAQACGPEGSAVRRELLRRRYLVADAPPTRETDLAALLGRAPGPSEAAAVVSDLQWALERQREALDLERIGWPAGELAPDELPDKLPDEELITLQHAAASFGAEIALRDAKIRRLEAEVYRRDAIIAQLRPAAEAPEEEPA